MQIQAKYGNGWFDAEVVDLGESIIKVKWGFGNSEQEKPRLDCRLKEAADDGSGESLATTECPSSGYNFAEDGFEV